MPAFVPHSIPRIRLLAIVNNARRPPNPMSIGKMYSRGYASKSENPEPSNTPHTPDSYAKDDTEVGTGDGQKTFVVDDGKNATQRPFDPPSGAYVTRDDSEPYDEPIPPKENGHKKSRYGNVNRESQDRVDGEGGPNTAGKGGRG